VDETAWSDPIFFSIHGFGQDVSNFLIIL